MPDPGRSVTRPTIFPPFPPPFVQHDNAGHKDFWGPKNRSKNGSVKKRFSLIILGIFGVSDANSGPFWDPKRVPGGYFLVFCLRKSCMSLSGSISKWFFGTKRPKKLNRETRDFLKIIVLHRKNRGFSQVKRWFSRNYDFLDSVFLGVLFQKIT